MMIARITVRSMFILSIQNIVLSEANIDANNQITIKDKISHDDTYNVRRMIEQQEQSTLSDTRSDIDSIYDSLDQTLLSFLSESSFGRQKVIELMIDQYVSPTTPDDNMTDKIDNAMEAMSFIETDGEPVQVVGYPYLFVGSVGESTPSLSQLASNTFFLPVFLFCYSRLSFLFTHQLNVNDTLT